MTPTLINRLRNDVWCIEPGHLSGYVEAIQNVSDLQAAVGTVAKMEREFLSIVSQEGATAVVNVSGVLGNRLDLFEKWIGGVDYQDVSRAIRAANVDDSIKQILMIVDSPGGSVIGCAEAAQEVANSQKPVYAYTDTLMASAGYHLSCNATAIYATPSSQVGSIGAIVLHHDISQRFKLLGINLTAIFKGKHKAEGAMFKPLSDEEKARFREKVESAHGQFSRAVRAARSGVSEKVFESRLYGADEALELGLLDGHVNNLDEALSVIG